MGDESWRILLVDDEPDRLATMGLALSQRGLAVTTAASSVDALAMVNEHPFDLVVVDVVMSHMDGLEPLERLRVLCTGHAALERTVEGFRLGAADFVCKLDGMDTLVGAIHRVLVNRRKPQILRVGDLTLHLAARRVWCNDREISLTKLEFDLLTCLVRSSGRVVSYDEMLTEVWGYGPCAGDPAQVRVTVSRLRQKLKGRSRRKVIVTVRGVGYRIDPD